MRFSYSLEILLDDGRLSLPGHPDQLRHARPSFGRSTLGLDTLENLHDLLHGNGSAPVLI